MFNSDNKQAPIQRLTSELALNVANYLQVPSILAFALTCKQFSAILSNPLLFRRLVERDFGINYKRPDEEQTWLSFYKELYTRSAPTCCRHLSQVPDEPLETKRVIYRASQGTTFRCDICRSQDAAYLNMCPLSDIVVCRSCLSSSDDDQRNVEEEDKENGVRHERTKTMDAARRFPVLLELGTNVLYCFECSKEGHKLGGEEAHANERFKVKTVIEQLQAEKEGALDRRRKAEHQLYVQELRREDMSLRHYLVEKTWGRSWMLFRTREGSPLPGRITNNKLARSNGTLDPSIRLPMDKYRPSPETHADIISEKLWSYLEKAYGVQGRAFSEDDLQFPEYARLRTYIEEFKRSILAYP